jgi:site-specific recombinase XerD
MTIEHALSQFCEHQKFIRGFSSSTIKRYRNAINLFTRLETVETLEQVSETQFKRYMLNGRTVRHWTANSYITYHKTFAVFFRWCITEGYMEENPADGMEMPKMDKRLPPKLTRQEATRILETAYNMPYPYTFLRYRNHAIFAMFLYAGLRKQELLSLTYSDVDVLNRSIFIRRGKGSKDRVVPICGSLAASLERYLVERRRLNKTCPEFFASLNRNVGFTGTGMKRLVEKINQASGIPFSAHKLRHSFATMMLEGGCDIYSLSRMMGHSDIKTTTIYLAASAEHLRGQITKHPMDENCHHRTGQT